MIEDYANQQLLDFGIGAYLFSTFSIAVKFIATFKIDHIKKILKNSGETEKIKAIQSIKTFIHS
jgi:hypothetical protein